MHGVTHRRRSRWLDSLIDGHSVPEGYDGVVGRGGADGSFGTSGTAVPGPAGPAAGWWPEQPKRAGPRAWLGVFRRTVTEFIADDLNDRAASLTYYSIMSIFPGLLVLVAGLSLMGSSFTDDVITNVRDLAPGPAREIILEDSPTCGIDPAHRP